MSVWVCSHLSNCTFLLVWLRRQRSLSELRFFLELRVALTTFLAKGGFWLLPCSESFAFLCQVLDVRYALEGTKGSSMTVLTLINLGLLDLSCSLLVWILQLNWWRYRVQAVLDLCNMLSDSIVQILLKPVRRLAVIR